jgi:phosphoglycerate dehydrogenase-like enzyme
MNENPIDLLIHYSLSEKDVQELQKLSDSLRITHYPETKFEEIPADVKENAEILLTSRTVPVPEEMPRLRWVQYTQAGIGMILDTPLLKREGFRATSLSGANAPIVAEYTVAALLAAAHLFPQIALYQNRKDWPPDRWRLFLPQELRGATVGLLGYGSIAREVARLLQPFNVEILAVKKDLMVIEDSGYIPKGTGDPKGELFRRLYPPEARKSMLKECDFVVVALPLTNETSGFVGKEELEAMKDTAILVAVGRGGQVDELALMEALAENKIGGAVLDVFMEEPLPADSPLWETLNLFITPHIAGSTKRYPEMVYELFSANLRRYLDGKELYNVFDPEKGY